jgi:hypothetical protein
VDAARAFDVDAVGLSISPAVEPRAAARALEVLAATLPPGIALWLGGTGAPKIAASAPRGHVTLTWPEVDAALAELRERLRMA